MRGAADALLELALFCRIFERNPALAKIGERNAKKAPPRSRPSNNDFFAFPESDGSAVGVGSGVNSAISLGWNAVDLIKNGSTKPN